MSVPELAQTSYKLCAALTAALTFVFYHRFSKDRFSDPRGRVFVLVVLCGTLVRLMIAWHGYGNYDGRSWEIIGDIASHGGNVYLETTRYNTSPVWFWTLGLLKKAHSALPALPFGFIVRSFLTLVDLATLWVLTAIARRKGVPPLQVALLFFLNPVSFLLTGYHGQFENLALLFLLLGVWASPPDHPPDQVRWGRVGWLWFFATLGLIVKHNIFYEVIAALNASVRKKWVAVALFLASCGLFFAAFLPYWKEGGERIVQNVFLYSSYQLDYGVSTFFRAAWIKYLFIAGLFLYPLVLREKDLIKRLLLCSLFFLVFTTGFGNQYLILPVALAALAPSRGFFVYSAVATLFLLGDQKNLGIPIFSWIPPNAVWLAAVYWFFSIHPKPAKTSGLAGLQVHPLKK